MIHDVQSLNVVPQHPAPGAVPTSSGLPVDALLPREILAAGEAQAALHDRAWRTTRQRFGTSVFVRGVVEISNFCRENCHYCGMRRDNRSLDRFRSTADALAELLVHHRPDCITDVNIQAGEDPVAVREVALPLIRTLRRHTPLGISVCLGTLSRDLTAELLAAGATTYIIKFEVSDPARYRALEAPGTLQERLDHIRWLASQGWKVSSGFIAGLPGRPVEDAVQDLRTAAGLPLIGCSVSPFVPGEATPLAGAEEGSFDITLNSMALLRILRPDWVIPAVSALNLVGPGGGYRRGLRAGANLCTINLTPSEVRSDYLLYRRDRIIMNEERVLEAIQAEGLSVSSQSLAGHLSA